jgi:hypothetical protein
MDKQHYTRVARLRSELDEIDGLATKVRAKLHEAIRDAFPEAHGQPTQRGVLAELARRSGYTREYVAAIRDGDAS